MRKSYIHLVLLFIFQSQPVYPYNQSDESDTDLFQSESLESLLVDNDVDCNDGSSNAIDGCSHSHTSDDVDVPIVVPVRSDDEIEIANNDEDDINGPNDLEMDQEPEQKVDSIDILLDEVDDDNSIIELHPAADGEYDNEEMEEMVHLEEFEDDEVEIEVSWITYYLSIINLSVLIVAFAAAAVCIMLIAYTIHRRRNEVNKTNHLESRHEMYYNTEYSPLNVVVT